MLYYIRYKIRAVRSVKKKKSILIFFSCVLLCSLFALSLLNMKNKPVTVGSFSMGSPVNITVYGAKEETAQKAAEEIKKLDSEYLSHNLSSSLVCRLNAGNTAEADEYFTEYLKKCLALSADSEKFTLLSGTLKSLWKTEDGGYVPTEEEINNVIPTLSEKNIIIEGNTVSLLNGANLDLGALGKGTACAAAIDSLKSNGAENAVCTVGGTVGVIGKPGGMDNFTIGVRNPFGAQNEYFGTLNVTDCFISTSGDYEKYFEKDGVRYCHIFDAETGKPVSNDITSVTVVAEDGTVSDFLSTAIFCEGAEKGAALARKYSAEFIIVKKDKTVFVSEGLKDKFTLTDNGFKVIS